MHKLAQSADLICYLDCQFSCRTQNDCLQFPVLRVDLLKKRNTKSCCFSGTCLCLTDYVMSGHHFRNRFCLDRAWLFKSEESSGQVQVYQIL